jgi:MFS family permease
MSATRDLRLLAGAVFVSSAGDLLGFVTLALVVRDLTDSGIAVSAFVASTMLPTVALAPWAGLLADRCESTRLLGGASVAQAAIALALALTTESYGAIVALSLLLAAGAAVSAPAEFALVPALPDELRRASGMFEAARNAGWAAGPLAAGALLGLGDARLALLVNAVSFLGVAVAARLLRTRRPPIPHGPGDRARDGFTVLWRDSILRPTVSAAILALAFFSASITVEVFYVEDVLHGGDIGYAATMLAWMVGMVAGSTWLARRVRTEALAAAALAWMAVQGVGIGLPTAWTVLPALLLGYLLGGAGHGAKNTLMRVLIARRVEERLHGRAAAAYNAARNVAEIFALAGGGLLVGVLGPRGGLALAGAIPAVVGLVALVHVRSARRARRARLVFT